jgi:hypothetical protein
MNRPRRGYGVTGSHASALTESRAKYRRNLSADSVVSLAQAQCAALIENMFGVTTSDDYRPVAWMGRYPVDVTTMLVGVALSPSRILTAILFALGGGAILAYLQFDSVAIWSGGQVWRLFTYAFVHQPALSDLLWLAIEMYMLSCLARGRTLYRAASLYVLYLVLLFLPAVV